MLVELAELQDREVGDGTTSVVIVASEFLKVNCIYFFTGFDLCIKAAILDRCYFLRIVLILIICDLLTN